MCIAILYWSATGSCEAAARAMAEMLSKREVHEVTLYNMREAMPKTIVCEHAVVILPVHAQDIPAAAASMLRSVEIQAASSSAVAVFGGVHAGAALRRTVKLLGMHNIPLTAAAELVVPHSYLRDLSADIVISDDTAERLADMVQLASQRTVPIKPEGKRQLLGLMPKRMLSHAAMKKPAHSELLCTGCTDCVKVCPTGAIGANLAIDNSMCIRCFACAQVCRSHAREVRFTNPVTWLYVSKDRKLPELVIYPKGLC